MTARDEVLARIRQANAAAGVIVGDTNQVVGGTNHPGAAAGYRSHGDRSLAERLDLLADQIGRAHV